MDATCRRQDIVGRKIHHVFGVGNEHADDLRVIQGDRPGIAVYIVWKSHVSEHRRNRGVGNKLYEGALNYLREKHAPQAAALVPMYCLSYGGTSTDARRVWDSLARRRESATPLAVLANPLDRDR